MKLSITPTILQSKGLKDTQPRRAVMAALQGIDGAVAPYDLCARMKASGTPINTVTVYRVLAALEQHGIVHRHPCNGLYSLCSIPDSKGHHGFLHCLSCGGIDEFSDARLCRMENTIARAARFQPSEHVSEIVGTCAACSA